MLRLRWRSRSGRIPSRPRGSRRPAPPGRAATNRPRHPHAPATSSLTGARYILEAVRVEDSRPCRTEAGRELHTGPHRGAGGAAREDPRVRPRRDPPRGRGVRPRPGAAVADPAGGRPPGALHLGALRRAVGRPDRPVAADPHGGALLGLRRDRAVDRHAGARARGDPPGRHRRAARSAGRPSASARPKTSSSPPSPSPSRAAAATCGRSRPARARTATTGSSTARRCSSATAGSPTCTSSSPPSTPRPATAARACSSCPRARRG